MFYNSVGFLAARGLNPPAEDVVTHLGPQRSVHVAPGTSDGAASRLTA